VNNFYHISGVNEAGSGNKERGKKAPFVLSMLALVRRFSKS